MKRKLLIGSLIFVAALLILPHTGFVEKRIWSYISGLAGDAGFDLKADDFDINLFSLTAKAKNLTLKGDGLDVAVEEAVINADGGILFGNIHLDEIRLKNGKTVLGEALFASEETAPSSEPFKMPSIQVGKAEIRGIVFSYEDQQQNLDFALNEFSFTYAEDHLSFSTSTEAGTFASRDLPKLLIQLEAETPTFQSFEDVSLRIESPNSTIRLMGRLPTITKPYLNLEAEIGEDLLPELSGLNLQGFISPSQVELKSQGTIIVDRPLDFQVQTLFDPSQEPLHFPLQISVSDWAKAGIKATYEGGDLRAEYRIEGIPHPYLQDLPLDLKSLTVEGNVALPQLDFAKLDVRGNVVAEGRPSLKAQFNGDGTTWSFEGNMAPEQGTEVLFSGTYDGDLSTDFQARLGGIHDLDPFLELPAALCSGPIIARGGFHLIEGNPSFSNVKVTVNQLVFDDYFSDTVLLYADGPPDFLQGWAVAPKLNPNNTFVEFALDFENGRWHGLQVDIPSYRINLDNYQAECSLLFSGSGPLTEPNLNGVTKNLLYQGSPIALLTTGFQFENGELFLPNFNLATSHGKIFGELGFNINTSEWHTNIQAIPEDNDSFQQLVAFEIPDFELQLSGSQETINANLDLKEQSYLVGDTPVVVQNNSDLAITGAPNQGRYQGLVQDLRIGGLEISRLDLFTEEKRFYASIKVNLLDPAPIRGLLSQYWPQALDLDRLNFEAHLNTDFAFEDPKGDLVIHQLAVAYEGLPLLTEDVHFRYDDRLKIDPFKADLAGVKLDFQPLVDRPESMAGAELDLQTLIHITLENPESLKTAAKKILPEDVEVQAFAGTVAFGFNLEKTMPVLDFKVDTLKMNVLGNEIASQKLSGSFNNGLKVRDSLINVAGADVNFKKTKRGFDFSTSLDADALSGWVTGLVGDGTMDISGSFANEDDHIAVHADIEQKSGVFVLPEPWVELSELQLSLDWDTLGNLRIPNGSAKLNNGRVNFSAESGIIEGVMVSTFQVRGENILIDLVDYEITVDTNLQWRQDPLDNTIRGVLIAKEGYLTPNLEIKGLIENLLTPIPELYFPDPTLEAVKLQVAVVSTAPIVMENDLGYVELTIPSLLIKGNLAEPSPASGSINILEGSTLKLGNQVFIFSESQVRFDPGRPDDPFLQLSMEYGDFGRRKPLNITGYVSKLDHDLNSENVTEFLAGYLLGRVSSLVSLESEMGETLFNSTFTFVVSKTLTRRVVTRYALPLNDQTSEERFELQLGPYRDNFFTVSNEDNEFDYTFRNSQKFGYPNGNKPREVDKIRWEPKAPRKYRKEFKLKSGDLITDTSMRRAMIDLERHLKAKGYLDPKVKVTTQKDKVFVDWEGGRKIALEIDGFEANDKQKANILRRLDSLDEAELQNITRLVENMVTNAGYPTAAAFTKLEGDILKIKVYKGTALPDNMKVSFGEADSLLDSYNAEDAASNFARLFVSNEESARAQLRARLAAKGYLLPEIGEGEFLTPDHLKIPVELGDRAIVRFIEVNDRYYEHDFIGKKFEYEMITKLAEDLAEDETKDYNIDIKPRRINGDLGFDVRREVISKPTYENLIIVGDNRIEADTIKRFLAFKPGMTQEELVKSHRRLIQSGAFKIARLTTTEDAASLEVQERNRYDLDFEVFYDSEREFGAAIQFRDRILFRGFHDLATRISRDAEEEQALMRLRSRRIFGTPIDTVLSLRYNNDLTPFIQTDTGNFGEEITSKTFTEFYEASYEVIYPLNERHQVTGGVLARHTNREVITEIDDPFFPSVETNRFSFDYVPIRLSWLYKNIDNEIDPRNGVLASFGVDQTLQFFETEEAFEGTRMLSKLSVYKTWGRFLWAQRFELGYYLRKISDRSIQDDLDESQFFTLGGSSTVRGYDTYFLGPIEVRNIEEGDGFEILARGGEGMAFFSQEISFDTKLYDIWITPFADGGWVWADRDDFLTSDPVISAGIGISIETPVGRFRVDWARPIYEEPFEEFLGTIINPTSASTAEILNATHQEWSFRFGKVF